MSNGLDVRSDVAVDRGVERLPRRHLRTGRAARRRSAADRRSPAAAPPAPAQVVGRSRVPIMPTPASPNAELCALRQVSARTAHGSTDGYIDRGWKRIRDPQIDGSSMKRKAAMDSTHRATEDATEAGHQGGCPTRRSRNLVGVACSLRASRRQRDDARSGQQLGTRVGLSPERPRARSAQPTEHVRRVSLLPTSPIRSSPTSCVAPSGSCGPAATRCC